MLNLIFDIDGTLLHTGGVSKKSFLKAFESVHNIKNFHDPVFKGGIDFPIYNEMLKIYNIKYNENKWILFKKEYSNLLEINYNKTRHRWIIFKNVFKLLDVLKDCKVKMYIVTGNIYDTALIKLKKTGLFKYFDKIFSCDKENERVKIIKKCLSFTGKENSIYVGDSDKDAEAAKLLNLPFIKITHNIEVHYNNKFRYENNENIKNQFDVKICCNKLSKMYKLLKKEKIITFYTIDDFYNYIID